MKKALAFALALVMGLSLAACGTTAPAATSGSDTPAATATGLYPGTPDADTVVLNLISEPPELNSILTTDGTAFTVLQHINEGLTGLDPENKAVPGVAESWDVSEDGLTWTFHLRDNAVWSNGEPVTANDFAFACFLPVNEKFYTEVGAEDGYALDMDKMLFNGPYVMSEWQHEDHITLTKNDNYWDKENKALIPTIKIVMIVDSGAGLNAFQAGEVDTIGLNGEQAELLHSEGANVGQYADGSPMYLQYNTKTPLLSSAKVRRAMTMAIDAESFNKNVAKNGNLVADGMVPPL